MSDLLSDAAAAAGISIWANPRDRSSISVGWNANGPVTVMRRDSHNPQNITLHPSSNPFVDGGLSSGVTYTYTVILKSDSRIQASASSTTLTPRSALPKGEELSQDDKVVAGEEEVVAIEENENQQ